MIAKGDMTAGLVARLRTAARRTAQRPPIGLMLVAFGRMLVRRVPKLGVLVLLGAGMLVWAPTAQLAHVNPTVVATIPVSSFPLGVGVNPATNRIYVSLPLVDTVSVIDGATNTVIANIAVGDFPHSIGVNAITNRVYVANRDSDTVSVVDGTTNTVIATIGVGNSPVGVGANPTTNRVYVANLDSGTVSVIDGATNTVIATIATGSEPHDASVNVVTNRIYVSLRTINRVAVIDGTTNTVIASIGVGVLPQGVDVNPTTNRIYVANTLSDNVSVIDGTTNNVIATVAAGGPQPYTPGVNPATNRVYVSINASNIVSVIDGATNTVVDSVVVGSRPGRVGVNPLTDRVYVADANANTVSVIGEMVGPPAMVTLAPKADTNPVGTSHTVTATVQDAFGNPVSGVTVRFSVSGANSASGSSATDANGQASFTYAGTTAGMDAISGFADTDGDGTQDVGEPGDTATKTWTPGAPATLTLAPPADVNVVGSEHCVTATVRDAFGNPVPGVTVRFSVPTSVATHASPSSGSATTGANGQATFCYTASLPGEDLIHAFADSDSDGMQEAGEPFDDATKTWTLPPSTAFCEVKVTQGGWIIADNGDRASFGGNAKVGGDGSVQGEENYQDHGPAQPRHVKSIELTAVTCSDDLTMATIFGTATIDGSGNFVFRIDVTDQGEPGRNDTYGIILSDGYASGQHQLRGGNVQIHKS